jgi:hypothetical protein
VAGIRWKGRNQLVAGSRWWQESELGEGGRKQEIVGGMVAVIYLVKGPALPMHTRGQVEVRSKKQATSSWLERYATLKAGIR